MDFPFETHASVECRTRRIRVLAVVMATAVGFLATATAASAMNKAELIEHLASGSTSAEVELLLTGPGPPVAGFDAVITYEGAGTTIEHVLLGRQVGGWSLSTDTSTPGRITVSATAPAGDSVVDELQGIVVLCSIDPGTVTFSIASIDHYDEQGRSIGPLETFGTTFTVTAAPLLGLAGQLALVAALVIAGMLVYRRRLSR